MNNVWRATAQPVKFVIVDARVGASILVMFVHWSWWTLALFALTTVIFGYLQYRGITLMAAIRRLRCWAIGRHRPARSWTESWRRQRVNRPRIG